MPKYRHDRTVTEALVKQQKSQIPPDFFELLCLAETYQIPEGAKIVKAVFDQPSKIIDQDGQDITPSNMTVFLHSVLNYQGTYYLLLHDVIFYMNLEDYDRGTRMGKLVVNKAGEVFFLKIIETTPSLYYSSFQKDFTSEMSIACELGEAPHNKFTIRKAPHKKEIKIYLLLRYRGLPLDIIIKNKALPEWQKLDIIIQCLMLVRENYNNGYIHRDIKLQNFVGELDHRTGNYKIFLIDFEYAVRKKNSYHISSLLAGTDGYHSPSLTSSYLYYVYNFKTDMFAAAVTIGQITGKISKKSLTQEENILLEKLIYFIQNFLKFSDDDIKKQIRLFEKEIDQIKHLLRACPQSAYLDEKPMNFEDRSTAYTPVNEQRTTENHGFIPREVGLRTYPSSSEPHNQELYNIREAVRNAVSEYTNYIEKTYRGSFLNYSLNKNHGKAEQKRAWRLEESINQAQTIEQVRTIFRAYIDSPYNTSNADTHNHSLIYYITNNSTLAKVLEIDKDSDIETEENILAKLNSNTQLR